MGYRAPFPIELHQVEYVKLNFRLEIDTYFDLPQFGLLQLRRELFQALRLLEAEDTDTTQLKQLLQPEISYDPVVVRQVQKPAPAVVISPDVSQYGLIEPQQCLTLPVLFVGSGVRAVAPFIALVGQLQRHGLYNGHGTFRLAGVEVEDGSGVMSPLWSAGDSFENMIPPVNTLAWWLERQLPPTSSACLEIISPVRTLHKGKPLFKSHFAAIFPYILRRVSSLVTAHAGVEIVNDPVCLLDCSIRVESVGKPLLWKDWRSLKSSREGQGLGGLVGTLDLEGDGLVELWWLLYLGQLFNIGKGAAYGAGQYGINYS